MGLPGTSDYQASVCRDALIVRELTRQAGGLEHLGHAAPRAPGANPRPFHVRWRLWPDPKRARPTVAVGRPWAKRAVP